MGTDEPWSPERERAMRARTLEVKAYTGYGIPYEHLRGLPGIKVQRLVPAKHNAGMCSCTCHDEPGTTHFMACCTRTYEQRIPKLLRPTDSEFLALWQASYERFLAAETNEDRDREIYNGRLLVQKRLRREDWNRVPNPATLVRKD